MTVQQEKYHGKLAVVYNDEVDQVAHQQLADKLSVPLYQQADISQSTAESFFLGWREGCLKLIDQATFKKGGLCVDLNSKTRQIRTWPAAKKGPLAQAVGRKTKTVVDATTVWAGDSFLIYSMGYDVQCIERSPVMAALLKDGLARFNQQEILKQLNRRPLQLTEGNAIQLLATLQQQPDCIYIDPMFPPKRKESALAKKSMMVLRDLLGNDEDKEQLFLAAFAATGRRVVVKMPDYAKPLCRPPDESFKGKLLRYDVYLKTP